MTPEGESVSSFKENHPCLHNVLYQLALVIISFECAIAIARYGPERDPAAAPVVPRSLLPRAPLSDANSTTTHICIHGAREDYVDLGPLTAITPYLILCPSTLTFLVALTTFLYSIISFNILHKLHKEEFYLMDPSFPIFIMTITCLDWSHPWVSLQISLPMTIWIGSVLVAVMNAGFRICFPGWCRRLREIARVAEEERKKKLQKNCDKGVDVEADGGREGEVSGVVSEVTPLNSVL